MADLEIDALLADESWREQLRSFSADSPEVLVSICDAFLIEVPELVGKIHQGVDQNDSQILKTASHTLKSCLRYVAVDDDVEFVAGIELDSGDPTKVDPERLTRLDQIARRWTTCVQTLRSETATT